MTTPKTPRDMIELLESGKYNPGRGMLYDKTHNVYCCLGVVAAESGVPLNKMEVGYPFVVAKFMADVPRSETGVYMDQFWDELVDAGWDSMRVIVDVPSGIHGKNTYPVYLPKHLASLNDGDSDNPVPFGKVIEFLRTLNDDWTLTR